MNKHKKTRLDQKTTKQPIADKLVTINRTANHNGLIPFTFDSRNAFSVMNASPAISTLGQHKHTDNYSQKNKIN